MNYANALTATIDTIVAVILAYWIHSILPEVITQTIARDARVPQLLTVVVLAFLFNLALQFTGAFSFTKIYESSGVVAILKKLQETLRK